MRLLDRLRGKESKRPVRLAIVMPWGRVGSNLLVAQFRDSFASRMTRIRNEPFNVIQDADEQLGWLRDFYGEANDDELLVASKHGLLSITDIEAFSDFLVEQDIKLIRHRRDNLVKVAVSQQRAELYAKHSTEEDGKARWGVLRGEKPLGKVDLDPAAFIKTLNNVTEAQAMFDAFRPDCPTYDLEYETLKADPVTVGRDVMQWMGLEPQRDIKLRFDKATPEKLRDAVPNLDALRQASADAGFADLDAMFDE